MCWCFGVLLHFSAEEFSRDSKNVMVFWSSAILFAQDSLSESKNRALSIEIVTHLAREVLTVRNRFKNLNGLQELCGYSGKV